MHFEILNQEPQVWTWVLMVSDGDRQQVITGGGGPLQDDCLQQIRDFKQSVADAAVPEPLKRNWT